MASIRHHRAAPIRYGAAVLLIAIALALKLLLVPLLTQDEPFLLFFAAVIAAAVFGGLGPGLLATALATLLDGYFFMSPYRRFELQSVDQIFRLTFFMAECVFVTLIAARLKSARRRAEHNAAEARELERRILEITDAEQRRIGSDLHDGLGQHLTGIALMTRRLEQRFSAASSPEAEDASKVSSLAKTAVAWTHDLSRSLSPPVLESAGLAEALRELAAHAESLFEVECTFEQSGEQTGGMNSLDVAISVHLYRIAQEAISNAVRHGKAKHVKLLLSSSAASINVQITDDGQGIDLAANSSNGMGLRIMQYRARMIGADLSIGHRDGGGTAVHCRYPLARPL